MTFVLILILQVWNVDSGERLFREVIEFTVPQTLVDLGDCRDKGIEEAHRLSREWTSQEHPNVTTNFSCSWEKVERLGKPA